MEEKNEPAALLCHHPRPYLVRKRKNMHTRHTIVVAKKTAMSCV